MLLYRAKMMRFEPCLLKYIYLDTVTWEVHSTLAGTMHGMGGHTCRYVLWLGT
jgi:hypothetical protein